MNADARFRLSTLPEVFGAGSRRFRVPPYQRSYSWESQQRNDLLDDIRRLAEHRSGAEPVMHFTGTLVARPTTEGSALHDIIDGQQRITSLVILCSELLRIPELSTRMHRDGSGAERTLREILIARGEATGRTEHALELNAETDEFFRLAILRDGTHLVPSETKAHENLRKAKTQFHEWIASGMVEPARALDVIVNQLGFLFYVPAQAYEAGLMFEVINNRGKPLSELDKVKNYLVYFATRHEIPDLEQAVKDAWSDILTNLNTAGVVTNDEENSFLRNAWIVFRDPRKDESHHVYSGIKAGWPPDRRDAWQALVRFVEFLQKASRTYARLLGGVGCTPAERPVLELLRLQGGLASVMPLLVSIDQCVPSESKRIALFDLVERLNFRFYRCLRARRYDTGQGHLFWLAHELHRATLPSVTKSAVPDGDVLAQMLIEFVGREADDAGLVSALTLDDDESFDFHTWGALKYFLANYEASLWEGGGQSVDLSRMLAAEDDAHRNDFFHREHVWAKAEKSCEVAADHYQKRRLANFVMLEPTLNIRASNDPVIEKLKAYDAAVHSQDPTGPQARARMLKELRDMWDRAVAAEDAAGWKRRTHAYYLNVHSRFLDAREERLVAFALKRWRVEYSGPHVTSIRMDSRRAGKVKYDLVPAPPSGG